MKLLRSQHGLTFVELVVVMGIIGMIATFTIPAYGTMRTNIALQNSSQEIQNAFRDAQNRSLASQDNGAYGVEVTASQYILFRTVDGVRTDVHSMPFPAGVSSSPTAVSFARLTGQTTASSVTLSAGSNTKVVNVDANGRVSIL